jgi:hypothetical protein
MIKQKKKTSFLLKDKLALYLYFLYECFSSWLFSSLFDTGYINEINNFNFHCLAEDIKKERKKQWSLRLILNVIRGQYLPIRLNIDMININYVVFSTL